MSVEVLTDPTRLDVGLIHHFLSNESYWAKAISLAAVRRCIEHSLCFGVFVDGRQVGFARVVSDCTRFAHILDLFVIEECRGLGYGKLLMTEILAHPDLSTVGRFTLVTADAHRLYARFGFRVPAKPEMMMELIRPQAGTSGS